MMRRRRRREKGQEEGEETVLQEKHLTGPQMCRGQGYRVGRCWWVRLIVNLVEELSQHVVKVSLVTRVRWVVLKLWWKRRRRGRKESGRGRS